MPAAVVVRAVGPGERATWEPLWKGYQSFYGVSLADETTDVLWRRLHDPAERMHVLGAYVNGDLAGIVHYLFHRTCWSVSDSCYLQDLFVAHGVRGGGVGRALIEAVYAAARAAGAGRVYWNTHESNAAARQLYDTLAERPGFIQYRKIF